MFVFILRGGRSIGAFGVFSIVRTAGNDTVDKWQGTLVKQWSWLPTALL